MIVTEAVGAYLENLRAAPDPLLAEMEAHGMRESIPIVPPETGQLLHILTLARHPRRVVEVGTAIGVSTLYMARALPPGGELVSFEVDERRHAAARGYLDRAGLLDRVDLRLQDAREGLAGLEDPVEMAFIDAVKVQYGDYFDLLLPLLGERAIVAVDNVLMAGTVAEGRGTSYWTDEQIEVARALNQRIVSDERFSAMVTPVGDGVLVAVRR